MVRGVARRPLFVDSVDCDIFLDRVANLVLETGTRCYAWCLMINHVHLVVRTGDQSVSKLMHRLGTSYAVRFNKRHERVGHLFQNRFKSQLVADEAYLETLIRYVLRNPLEAGLVKSAADLEQHSWTAYGVLLGLRPARFEDVSGVLGLFAEDHSAARRLLRAFVRSDAEALPDAHRIPSEYEPADPPPEAPQEGQPLHAARPRGPTEINLERVIACACRAYGVDIGELKRGARTRSVSVVRALLAHLATRVLGIPGTHVAQALGVSEGALTRAARRGRVVGLPEALRAELMSQEVKNVPD